jgi:hypothetical protein
LSAFRNLRGAFIPALCALLAVGGCMTRRSVQLDANNPAVRVSLNGVLFGDVFVKPQEVPEILDDYGVPRGRVIHILLDANVRDLREARFLMGCLARAGYTRPVLVTRRHAEAVNLGKRGRNAQPAKASAAKRIRYKKAGE